MRAYDFTGREAMLGLAMTQLVRTLNHNQSYQHEMNDALVKMTLDHIMFAKRNGMLKQMVDEDINSQRQQLERVRKLIERTGNRDLAIVGIFEQTSCFFQLVDRTERAPGRVTYRSPYRTRAGADGAHGHPRPQRARDPRVLDDPADAGLCARARPRTRRDAVARGRDGDGERARRGLSDAAGRRGTRAAGRAPQRAARGLAAGGPPRRGTGGGHARRDQGFRAAPPDGAGPTGWGFSAER